MYAKKGLKWMNADAGGGVVYYPDATTVIRAHCLGYGSGTVIGQVICTYYCSFKGWKN